MRQTKKVFVHRYKWSHYNRRKQLRKALKAGTVTIILTNDDGWLYEVHKDFKVKK